ncbi:hypothetical protein JCM10908_005048 [Rhodotorula pacifica]|uniref:uncharacterized protein n=1 Tax=Rhodotorula pacifica TaxID=1495444 RepID=UPI0031796A44
MSSSVVTTANPEPAASFTSGRLTTADPDGDSRMRSASEEPSAAAFPNMTSSAPPSAPAAATTNTTTVQRNPSLRARDAFARLRIGSAGSATAARPALSSSPSQLPSNVGASTSAAAAGGSNPASPVSGSSNSSFSTATASAIPVSSSNNNNINGGSTSGISLSRAGSIRSPSLAAATAPGAGPGMTHASPAASFLSAFSPPSSVGNRSPSPPAAGARLGNMPAFGSVLPPRGDQSGYKICVPASAGGGGGEEGEYEYEYVLGKELGRGGMGLVREATRRKVRRRHRGRSSRREGGRKTRQQDPDGSMVEKRSDSDDSDEAIVDGTSDDDNEEEEEEEVVKVAVKIIPRHQGHALPFSEAMGIRTGVGIGGGGGAGIGGPVRAAMDGGMVTRSASLRQGHSTQQQQGAPMSHVHRSFSVSQSHSPYNTNSSAHLLRHHPSQFPPSPTSTTSTSAVAVPTNVVHSERERNRSASSPARKAVASLNLGYGTGTGVGRAIRPGTLSRGISLAAVEQSPLPTPDGREDHEEGNANMLGTSAPERDPGGFFARARASTVSHHEAAGSSGAGSRGSSGTRSGNDEGDGKEDCWHGIDLDTAEPEDLLDLLLQREISLWRQLTNLVPVPHTGTPMPRPTGFTGKGGHPYVVALLGTHRSDEYDYIFMPLAEGGTLLEYLNDPSSSSSRETSTSRRSSGSRSRSPSPSSRSRRSASPPSAREQGNNRSASRGRGRVTTTTKPRPRASIPFAGSLSPPSSLAASMIQQEEQQQKKKGLSLRRAGEIFLQVVDGLRWLHEEARVVHRDLKLENVVGCWSVATDEELAAAAGAGGDGKVRGRSRSRMRQDEEHEMRGWHSSSSARHRRKRVWKLADFGLAEILPQHQQQQVGVQGVQPLAALARAGSLHRPDEGRQQHALGSSVGPGSGMSQSAILPRAPHHASTLPPQQMHRPSPTAVTMQAQTVSPLSALLHPVGSLPYSSPEALRSSVPIVHPSGDIWALGCVLYALVAGRLPIWDEWELRLRVQLVKGEWNVPDELDSTRARNEEDRVEREMVLEVLKGCLEKDVDRRWTIRQVCESRWLTLVRQREVDLRAGRTPTASTLALQVDAAPALPRRSSRTRSAAQNLGLFLDVQPTGSGRSSPARSPNLALGPSPSPTSPNADRTMSRGRPSTRSSSHSYGYGPPPAPSAGASGHHTAEGGSSPVIGRGNLPGVAAADERGRSAHPPPKSASRSRTRLSTRSTSRSSAYAHQFGASGSELGEQERKERGRSERRRRWDEAGSSSGRRSVSRTSTGTTSTSASGMMDDTSGLTGQSTPAEQDEDLMLDDEDDEERHRQRSVTSPSAATTQRAGRSASRRRHGAGVRGDRDDSGGRSGNSGHHLETVGEPY